MKNKILRPVVALTFVLAFVLAFVLTACAQWTTNAPGILTNYPSFSTNAPGTNVFGIGAFNTNAPGNGRYVSVVSTNKGYSVTQAGTTNVNGTYLWATSLTLTNTANIAYMVYVGGNQWEFHATVTNTPSYVAIGTLTNATGLSWDAITGSSPMPMVATYSQIVTNLQPRY